MQCSLSEKCIDHKLYSIFKLSTRYAPTSLTHSQAPFRFSFHKLTFPSPAETASTLPVTLHDTLHTTSGNLPS